MIQIHCVRSNSFTLFRASLMLSCWHLFLSMQTVKKFKVSERAQFETFKTFFTRGCSACSSISESSSSLPFVSFTFILFCFILILFVLFVYDLNESECVCVCTVHCAMQWFGCKCDVPFQRREEKEKIISFELRMVSYRQWHRQTTDEQRTYTYLMYAIYFRYSFNGEKGICSTSLKQRKG